MQESEDGLSVMYFRSLLKSETLKLKEICDIWECKIDEGCENIPSEIQGDIRSTVGQGRLVIAERFDQFSGLIDNCEFKKGEKETTCMDLQGFWEMIYIQVEDVYHKFSRLSKLESSGWVNEALIINEDCCVKKKPNIRRKGRPSKATISGSSGFKAFIAQQRKNMKSDVNMNDSDKVSTNLTSSIVKDDSTGSPNRSYLSPERVFDGGFFSVKSPATLKIPQSPRNTRSAGCEKIMKIVKCSSSKRLSGLVSPYVSQVAKRVLDVSHNSPMSTLRRSTLFEDE